MPENRPRRTERQATQIIRRAIELQESGISAPQTSSTGTEELIRAAKELGIQEQFIIQALEESDSNVMPHRPGFFGGPTTAEIEFEVPGELTDAKWEDIVLLLRKRFGDKGESGVIGRTRDWSRDDGGIDKITVSITPRDGGSRVRIYSDLNGGATVSYILSLLPTLFLTVAVFAPTVLNPAAEAVIGLAAFAAMFGTVRYLVSRFCRKRIEAMQRLMSSIENRLDEDVDVRETFSRSASVQEAQTDTQITS